jgi:hypothetical protein
VWLLRVRPRRFARDQLARAEAIGAALGLPAIEPGLARGARDVLTVEVAYGLSSTAIARGGHPITTCRVWLATPLPVAFTVVLPRRYAAGATEQWSRDVWIGGPDEQARELAASFAPLVESHATAARGSGDADIVELDRATCNAILEGHVVDPARVERALAVAVGLAKAIAQAPVRDSIR